MTRERTRAPLSLASKTGASGVSTTARSLSGVSTTGRSSAARAPARVATGAVRNHGKLPASIVAAPKRKRARRARHAVVPEARLATEAAVAKASSVQMVKAT